MGALHWAYEQAPSFDAPPPATVAQTADDEPDPPPKKSRRRTTTLVKAPSLPPPTRKPPTVSRTVLPAATASLPTDACEEISFFSNFPIFISYATFEVMFPFLTLFIPALPSIFAFLQRLEEKIDENHQQVMEEVRVLKEKVEEIGDSITYGQSASSTTADGVEKILHKVGRFSYFFLIRFFVIKARLQVRTIETDSTQMKQFTEKHGNGMEKVLQRLPPPPGAFLTPFHEVSSISTSFFCSKNLRFGSVCVSSHQLPVLHRGESQQS